MTLTTASRLSTKRNVICTIAVLTAACGSATRAAELNYVHFSTVFSHFSSIDCFEPTNEVVASSYYPNGLPHNFRRIAADGSQSQYTTVAGLIDEIKVATARSPKFG